MRTNFLRLNSSKRKKSRAISAWKCRSPWRTNHVAVKRLVAIMRVAIMVMGLSWGKVMEREEDELIGIVSGEVGIVKKTSTN